MKKYFKIFLNSLTLLFILGALFLLQLVGHPQQISAQTPIMEVLPSPITIVTLIPAPSTISATGTPITAPTPEIIAITPVIYPITPFPTLGFNLDPKPTSTLPIIVNPSPYPTVIPTSSPTPATYWVSLGLNGIPADQINSAEKLLDYLSLFGTDAIEIDRWYNGGWDSHLNNLPFNDFPIEVGKGFEVAFRGKPNPYFLGYQGSYPSPLSITYNLSADWNFISIPEEPFKNFTYPARAENLCEAINSQGGSAAEIDYHETMPGPTWTPHICGSNENNFYITSGYGYLIKANSPSIWTLSAPTLTTNKVSFNTPQVSLDADDFYILANNQKFAPHFQDVTVHSDPGTSSYTTLELTWYENGVEMRMYIYFKSDGINWWSEEVRTYNGNDPGDWIYYYPGKIFETKLNDNFYAPTFDLASNPNGQIHFTNLHLKAFANYVSSIPTPTITPTPHAIAVPTSGPTLTPAPTVNPTATPAPNQSSVPTDTPTITPTVATPSITLAPRPQREKPIKDLCYVVKIRNSNPKYPFINLGDILKCTNSTPKISFNPLILSVLLNK